VRTRPYSLPAPRRATRRALNARRIPGAQRARHRSCRPAAIATPQARPDCWQTPTSCPAPPIWRTHALGPAAYGGNRSDQRISRRRPPAGGGPVVRAAAGGLLPPRTAW